MTYAPQTYRDAREFLIDELDVHPGSSRYPADLDPAEVGIVGSEAHKRKGTSYHLGADDLIMSRDPYSARLTRDRRGLTDGASALDIGQFRKELTAGRVVTHRTLGTWLVAQCQAGAPDAAWIREVIWSPDGRVVLRYDRERGQRSAPRQGEADDSHLTHDHISGYRDCEHVDKTAVFRRFIHEIEGDMELSDRITYTKLPGVQYSSTGTTVAGVLAGSFAYTVLTRNLVLGLRTEVTALRTIVEQLAATITAGGGSVDTAAILAGVDARLAELPTADEVADAVVAEIAS